MEYESTHAQIKNLTGMIPPILLLWNPKEEIERIHSIAIQKE